MSVFATSVIPHATANPRPGPTEGRPKRKLQCGTHKHRSPRNAPRIWVPDKRFALSGMTVRGTPQ